MSTSDSRPRRSRHRTGVSRRLWRTYVEGEVNDIPYDLGTEQTRRLLDFLQVLVQHAKRERAQTIRTGYDDEGYSVGVLPVSWNPNWCRLALVLCAAFRRSLK